MDKKIIINIGRQFGGGGLGVAHELGRKLGIPVYDKELIQKAAQDSGFSKELFEERDEKKRFFSLSSIFANRYSDTENYMSDSGLFKIQSDTIRKIAEQGSAIIVGRCADYALREYDNVINVFLHGDVEKRVQRAVDAYGIDYAKAAEEVIKTDKQRASYYNFYTGRKWGDIQNYDLTIDSTLIGIDNTVKIIKEFVSNFMCYIFPSIEIFYKF